MTATRPPMLAADYIRELTRHHTTTERVDRLEQHGDTWKKGWGLHTVTHAPLLDQLEEAITTAKASDEPGRSSTGSKPAARLDALATLQVIDAQSKTKAADLGIPLMPMRPRLAHIAGALGDKSDARVKSWWGRARVDTGWDAPPFKPTRVPCPIETCEQRGGLRIHLVDHVGYCTHCGTFWDSTNITLLGSWVKYAAEHLEGPRHWLHDPDGELVECTECLTTRDAMAERAILRARLDDSTLRKAGA